MSHSCRHCGAPLDQSVVDLGHQPPSNAYLREDQLHLPETTYPLKVYVCTSCWLVQLPAHASAQELFTDSYAYFSSTSRTWCAHASLFARNAIKRLGLGSRSLVVEIASNDGYLLQYFKEAGIPCVGIEPTHATAQAAQAKGIHTVEKFFGSNMASELEPADLVVANNVLAHVPDINDFVAGIARILKPQGVVSIEFPHLYNLIRGNQFDTIYHEHYSYLSLSAVQRVASQAGLQVIDVDQLSTHGGSLRVWLSLNGAYDRSPSVDTILALEADAGLETLAAYQNLQRTIESTKYELIDFLIKSKSQGHCLLGYGAAAKGNTLLNYAGIKSDLLPAVADMAPSKQGMYLPGSHIPIISPEHLSHQTTQFLLVLPWNLIDEIQMQFPAYTLVTAIPHLTLHTNA